MNNLKSRKKLNLKIMLVAVFMLVFSMSTNIFAATSEGTNNLFDLNSTNGVYKFSEHSDIYLPFIRYATDRIVVDKEISNIGALASSKSIEVNEKTIGLKLLFASDSVRVNSEMEYPFVISGSSVVIDSNITRSAIIIASDSITVTENANISDDVILLTKNLNIEGNVDGSVIAVANTLNVSGKILKDLRVDTTNINISEKDNVSGNIYIRTTNSNLTGLSVTYPNAKIDVYSIKSGNNFTIARVMNLITVSLLFAVLYILIDKLTNKKFSTAILNKTTQNSLFTVLSGTLYLVTIPIVLIILLVACIFNLSAIALPIIVAYSAFTIIIFSLSTFIVGTYLYTFVRAKYMKDNNVWMDIIGSFASFMTLKVLANIDVISGYVTIAILIFAVGMSLSTLFKKQKN